MTGNSRTWWLWLWFVGLTGLVAYPWFREPGFLFLLDFVWPTQLPVPGAAWQAGHVSSLPWQWLWWALATFFPTDVVQKIAFTLPLFLGGVAATQLVRWLLTRINITAILPAIAAGTFYILNPFVVTRVIMGQYYLLLAYALTPWALLAWLRFVAKPSVTAGLVAGVAISAVILTNAHHLMLAPFLIIFLLPLPRQSKIYTPRHALAVLMPLGILGLATMLAHQASSAAYLAFQPLGPWARAVQAPFTGNLVMDVLTLTATWKLDLLFLFPHESLPGFGILAGLLLLVMGVGIVAAWRHPTLGWLVRRLVLLSLACVLLTIGVAHPLTEPLAAWLYEHVPFWLGLRDSGKFMSLLAVSETILLGLGLAVIPRFIAPAFKSTHLKTVLRLLPPGLTVIIMATLIWPAQRGFDGQIIPQAYPSSWHEWQAQVATYPRPVRTLFLPWHMYLPFEFTAGRTVVNPAPGFFTNSEIISGDNSEVGGTFGRPFIATESARPLSRQIEQLLAAAPAHQDMGRRLAAENIRFIMLATEAVDTTQYDYLNQQRDLRLVFERPDLVVWENTALAP